ncbi:MAG: hypothetical protein ACLP8S_02880 [Solirubrobacteraceae bacterium]
MSPERTNAYRRVIKTVNELGPSKLLGSEQERIRYAADNLLFSSDLAEDVAAREALVDVERLFQALTESGRWEQVTAARLANDLCACGPPYLAGLRAA